MRIATFSIATPLAAMAFVALTAYSSTASATQPLADFLREAASHNYDAREAKALFDQRDAEADASLGKILPVLSAKGTYTRNQYEAAFTLPGSPTITIIPQDQWDAFVTLDVPIIDLASYYRYRSSKATAQAASYQKDSSIDDSRRSVAKSYYQFLGAGALVDSANRSLVAAQANQTWVQSRLSAGAATDLDLQRASANTERARQDIADALLSQALSARSLETLSGLTPTPADQPIEASLEPETSLDSWVHHGETPAQAVARRQADAAAYGETASKMALLPVLSAQGNEHFTNATSFTGKVSSYTLLGILSWRLDYGTISTANAQNAAAQVSAVRAERASRAVEDAVFEAWQRVSNGIAKSKSAAAQDAAAQKASKLAEDRFRAGVATQLDVTQAQRDAYQADAVLIQSQADLAYARIALRIAANRPLTVAKAP